MKKQELEKLAKSLLEKHPSKDAVYMTEDGQGFFNKDARNNHAKGRGGLEVYDFFREGIPTPQETTDAIKALEVAAEKVARYETANETIEKVFTDDAFEITVTPETDPMVALAASVKEQLEEAKGLANEAANLENDLTEKTGLLETATNDLATVKEDFKTAETKISELETTISKKEQDVDKAYDALKERDSEIAALKEELKESKKALAAANKKK